MVVITKVLMKMARRIVFDRRAMLNG